MQEYPTADGNHVAANTKKEYRDLQSLVGSLPRQVVSDVIGAIGNDCTGKQLGLELDNDMISKRIIKGKLFPATVFLNRCLK